MFPVAPTKFGAVCPSKNFESNRSVNTAPTTFTLELFVTFIAYVNFSSASAISFVFASVTVFSTNKFVLAVALSIAVFVIFESFVVPPYDTVAILSIVSPGTVFNGYIAFNSKLTVTDFPASISGNVTPVFMFPVAPTKFVAVCPSKNFESNRSVNTAPTTFTLELFVTFIAYVNFSSASATSFVFASVTVFSTNKFIIDKPFTVAGSVIGVNTLLSIVFALNVAGYTIVPAFKSSCVTVCVTSATAFSPGNNTVFVGSINLIPPVLSLSVILISFKVPVPVFSSVTV